MARAIFAWAALLAALTAACDESATAPYARAYRITERSGLVGGPKELGNIGDYAIENDRIRVVVNGRPNDQVPGGINRWGGAIADADIRRPDRDARPGDRSHRGRGEDRLIEIMPALDVRIAGTPWRAEDGRPVREDADAIQVTAPGGPGATAELRMVATLQNLLDILKIVGAVAAPRVPIRVENIYRLAPGSHVLEVETIVTRLRPSGELPDDDQIEELPARPVRPGDQPAAGATRDDALGDGLFLGASLSFLGPGVFGFSPARWADNLLFRNSSTLVDAPQVEWVAGIAPAVGYAIALEDGPIAFPIIDDLLTLAVYRVMPDGNARFAKPGARYRYKRHIIIDDGDAAGLLDHVIRVQNKRAGRIDGRLIDARTNRAAEGTVLVFKRPIDPVTGAPADPALGYDEVDRRLRAAAGGDENARLMPYSRFRADARWYDRERDGSFEGALPVGDAGEADYWLLPLGPGNVRGALVPVRVRENETARVTLLLPPTGSVAVDVYTRNAYDHREPVKITVESLDGAGLPDVFFGQPFFPDRVARVVHTTNGQAEIPLPAGRYRIIANRGYEYDAPEATVTIIPQVRERVLLSIERVLDTTGWVSGDMHIHQEHSPDSGLDLDSRALSIAVEGLEFAAATDHDVITNLLPAIMRFGGQRFTRFMHGEELSQLSYGHFNGYPLRFDYTQTNGGAVPWRDPSPTTLLDDNNPDAGPFLEFTPQDLFDDLRRRVDRGRAERPFIVVNHSQEAITGYLRTWGYMQYAGTFADPDTLATFHPMVSKRAGADKPPYFSFDFDGMEVVNPSAPNDYRSATLAEGTRAPASVRPNSVFPTLVRTLDEQNGICDGSVRLHFGERGMLDDWFTLTAQGRFYTGVGVSDTHNLLYEVGKGRTWVRSRTDDPKLLDERSIIAALHRGEAIAASGPFIEAWVNDRPIASRLSVNDAAVRLRIKAQAAPWVSLDRIEIYANGILAGEIGRDAVPEGVLKCRVPPLIDYEGPLPCNTAGVTLGDGRTALRLDATVTCVLPRDAAVVVLGVGYTPMTPYMLPNDRPGVLGQDGLIQGFGEIVRAWFGPAFSIDSAIRLDARHPYWPYTVTNPVFVDIDGDADGDGDPFEWPGAVPGCVEDPGSSPERWGPSCPPTAKAAPGGAPVDSAERARTEVAAHILRVLRERTGH